MGLLLYKSSEMFSSTELIRKSKMIFDKILGEKIEKAIILRDGKPSFLLMEFSKYEKIMAEYEELKEYAKSLEKEGSLKDKKLKQELEEEAKALNMEGGDYSDITKQEIVTEDILPPQNDEEQEQQSGAETEEVVANPIENKMKPVVENLSEDEEIQKAYASIDSMNLDEEMKKEAKEKVRVKILIARKERMALEKEREQKMQQEKELELKVQKEKLKKEQELEEFWD